MIKVQLFKRKSRKNWEMKWKAGDNWVTRSTGCKLKRDAQQVAFEQQKKLESEQFQQKFGWNSFCDRYESECLELNSGEKNLEKWNTVRSKFEKLIDPKFITDLETNDFLKFIKLMKADERAPATIENYLGYLKAAMNWAAHKSVKIINEAPYIPIPKVDDDDAVAGRPLTMEEFERMLMQVPKVFSKHPDSITYFLWGIFHSGLRIGEAMRLTWDKEDTKTHQNNSGNVLENVLPSEVTQKAKTPGCCHHFRDERSPQTNTKRRPEWIRIQPTWAAG